MPPLILCCVMDGVNTPHSLHCILNSINVKFLFLCFCLYDIYVKSNSLYFFFKRFKPIFYLVNLLLILSSIASMASVIASTTSCNSLFSIISTPFTLFLLYHLCLKIQWSQLTNLFTKLLQAHQTFPLL